MISVSSRTGVEEASLQWCSGQISLSHWGLSKHYHGRDVALCCNQPCNSGKMSWTPLFFVIHTVDQWSINQMWLRILIYIQNWLSFRSDKQHMPYFRWKPSGFVHGVDPFGEWECWCCLWLLSHCFSFCLCVCIGVSSLFYIALNCKWNLLS